MYLPLSLHIIHTGFPLPCPKMESKQGTKICHKTIKNYLPFTSESNYFTKNNCNLQISCKCCVTKGIRGVRASVKKSLIKSEIIWYAWKDALLNELKVWKWGFVKSKKVWNQIKIWTLTSLRYSHPYGLKNTVILYFRTPLILPTTRPYGVCVDRISVRYIDLQFISSTHTHQGWCETTVLSKILL